MPCSPSSFNRRFGGTYRLHLQGRRNKISKNQQASSSKTSVETQQTTWRHIPEDDTLHNHRCENLTSYIKVLLGCNADGTGKFPPLHTGKSENTCCFIYVRKLPTKYAANRKAWVTQASFTDYVRALDAKISSQNRKILLLVNQCAAHPQDTSYIKNVKVMLFLPD
jgi:hypothetical protein